MAQVFGARRRSGFEQLAAALYLQGGPYANPYELMTFYDNHDMARLDASDEGFIDAHNWLFTARGIPVVYYGSEIGFMRGRAEHAGNRNYFGQERVDAAAGNPDPRAPQAHRQGACRVTGVAARPAAGRADCKATAPRSTACTSTTASRRWRWCCSTRATQPAIVRGEALAAAGALACGRWR